MKRTFIGRVLHGTQRFALLGAALLLAANTSCAASFDCAKAGTKVEKMICGDPELSKLDEELGKVYSEALKKIANPSALKLQQREWMKVRNLCQEGTCLKSSYRRRINAIAATLEEMKVVPLHAADETYALVMSKNNKMCNYMRQLMNVDLHRIGRGYDSNDRFVNTQEVFKSIHWKPARASYKIAGKVDYSDVEGAVFDLNNDGALDYVVRDKGMLSGMRADALYVFNRSMANKANDLTAKELFEAKDRIELAGTGYPLSAPLEGSGMMWLLSPFIYHGVSYIYMQSLYEKDEAIGGDFVVIVKYFGGKFVHKEMTGKMEDICYIERVSAPYFAPTLGSDQANCL